MSDDRAESKYRNLGYNRDHFSRDDSDVESEPEVQPKLEPEVPPEVEPEVERLEVGVQLMMKGATLDDLAPVRKAPPMYHPEERPGPPPPPPLHQLRPVGNRGVRPETVNAILRRLHRGQTVPSPTSTTDESHDSHDAASGFKPRTRTPERVERWEKLREIDQENYMSRWNQDTELIRLTRRGDVQGLENYQQKLSNTYRCMIEINTLNACFLSPLAIALYHGNQRAIRILLAMGARPDVRLSFGNNCFHLVAENDTQGVTLTCLLEGCQEIFSREEFDKMLNTPNMFNANPLDVLHLRLAQQKPDMHQLQVMVTVMENHGARTRAGILPDNNWFSHSTM